MARRRSQQAYELPAGRMVNGFSTRRSGTARARRCVSCIAEAAGTQTCFIFIGDKHAYNIMAFIGLVMYVCWSSICYLFATDAFGRVLVEGCA